MSRRLRFFGPGALLALCGCLAGWALAACDPGPRLPEVRDLEVRRYGAGRAGQPWVLRLRGQGFESSAAHPLRFELWRESPALPLVRVALEGLRHERTGVLVASVAAGIAPGHYRLIAFRGRRWRSTPLRLQVESAPANTGNPVLNRVSTRRPQTGEGGRLIITGANLLQPVLVTLHGPVSGAVPDQAFRERALVTGLDGKGQHVQGRVGRLSITELAEITAASPTRLMARIPPTLRPGDYYVRVYTATNAGHQADVMATWVTATARPRWGLLWIAWLLGGLVLGVLLFGRPFHVRRGAILQVLALALICLVPLFITVVI